MLFDQSDAASPLVGWGPVKAGPAQLAASRSYIAGLRLPVVAGSVSFALVPLDAAARPILADPQVCPPGKTRQDKARQDKTRYVKPRQGKASQPQS